MTGDKSKPAGAVITATAKRFEELTVWQTSRALAKGVYHAIRTQPVGRDAPLSYQMRKSAISIGSNIAEGYERGSRKQEIDACYTAKGSAGELRSQAITAHDAGLLDDRAFAWLVDTCEKCSRQLHAYIAHLKETQSRLKGAKFVASKRPERRKVGSS